MKLSFIVVTYNRGPLLQQCLESIYNQINLPPYEVLVIDNGGNAELSPPSDPKASFQVFRPDENLGAAGGRNLGMQLATGEILITLDDDAVWTQPDTVARMMALFENNPQIGAVAARSLAPDKTPITIEQPHPDKSFILKAHDVIEIPYFYAMGVAIRAEAIDRVGGYPEHYRIYMEEVDLSYRLLDAKYRILFDPNIAVIHYKTNLGRPVAGDAYWKNSAINKSRLAWRLLPLPYPITIMLAWSGAVFFRTRKLSLALQVWREIWQERKKLRHERQPIRTETVRYIQRIGGRLLY